MDGRAIGPARVIALSGARERAPLVAVQLHNGPTLLLSTQEARGLATLLYEAAAAGDADAAFERFLCEELGRDLDETMQMLEEFRRLRTLAHTDG
jgi:hypothetical protein